MVNTEQEPWKVYAIRVRALEEILDLFTQPCRCGEGPGLSVTVADGEAVDLAFFDELILGRIIVPSAAARSLSA